MTVADLIAKLREYPGDALVVTPEGIRNVPVQYTWIAADYEDDSGEASPAVVIL